MSPTAANKCGQVAADEEETKKRKRGSTFSTEKSASEAKNETKKGEMAKSTPPRKKQAVVREDRLQCIVCMDLPEPEVLQCSHGHLLCKECYDRSSRH